MGGDDDVPTVVNASRRAAGDEEPTRLDTPRTLTSLTSLSGSTVALPQPETVLRRAEIEQSRRTAISGVLFNVLGLLCAPFFGGDRLAHTLFVAGLACGALANAGLYYASSSEARYRERWVLGYFLLAPFFNGAVMYYLGVFSPILVIMVLNLYSVCLGYGRRVALVTLGACILPIVALGTPMALDVIADPGLITVTDVMGSTGRMLVVVAYVAFLVLTYAQARSTREIMVASLVERDEAVRRASHREALFLEARQDLENALRAGGFGRFSDQVLGSYRLGAVLGRGGMGEIYEATHVDSGDAAAVKLLLPEVIGNPEYVRRFLREVHIAAALDSPHVVRVLEVGSEGAPLPYLAMERLRGEDLAQILRRDGRLKASRVVELVRQVGRGLAAANAEGVVHRDLKPQNLFLCEGKPRLWKILDFGVSKRMDGEATLTRGHAIGTPHYMAPEQASGREVDARADLYGLGAIAYRALTGHQPFKGEDLAAILFKVIASMPVRPSALADVHGDVDLALTIALAKDPATRFDDPEELADALAAAVRGKLGDDYRQRARTLLEALPWDEAA